MRPRNQLCWVAATLLIVIVIGCGGGTTPLGTPQIAVTATVAPADSVDELIPSPETTFAVEYSFHGTLSDSSLVWRQRDGWRRWDFRESDSDGLFVIETGFLPGSAYRGRDVMGCLWFRRGRTTAHVECSGEPIGLDAILLYDVLSSARTGSASAQRIFERDTNCYELTHPEFDSASICLDTQSNAPLRIQTHGAKRTTSTATLEAINADPRNIVLGFPVALDPSRDSFGSFHGDVPIEQLDLP